VEVAVAIVESGRGRSLVEQGMREEGKRKRA
jgi:hypothetical protein